MNEILIKGGQLLLSLSILILLHEFGHFMAARIFKTRVEKFYLFFNPWFSIFKFRKGETEYGLGWLPLGGYVKISGMIDESMDKEQMKQPSQPWEFRSKPAWQRLIIMLGGIIMNVLLGIFIYAMVLFFNGEAFFMNKDLTHGIMVNPLGMEMGFQNGDKIVAVDGKPVNRFNRIAPEIVINCAKEVTVDRNGTLATVTITEEHIKKVIDNKSMDFISMRLPFVIENVSDTSVAKKAGLQPGDRFLAIDGKPVTYLDEVRAILDERKDSQAALTVLRGTDTFGVTVMIPATGILGVQLQGPDQYYPTTRITYSFFGAFPAGTRKAYETLVNYVKQFSLVFSSKVQGYKHIGGFISIANAYNAKWVWADFWSFTGFLSIALAFMNLLPIPALDGGHVLFTLVEMVTRRKPNEKFLEYAQVTGMILLLALLVYANGNDIFNLFR